MALAVSNLMELCYGTRSFPQSIDLPGAWQGNQFSDESEYQAESDLVGLELDGDLICRQNFPLPTVGIKLELMRLNVYEGKGFGLVRGLNPLSYSTEDLTMMYLGIQSYIANRRGRQDEKGNMLVHIVADNSSPISSQHHRHSTSEITFHNEESGDIVSWLTRSTAASGGRCIIASGYAVYNILNRHHPASIHQLSQPKWVFANQEGYPRPIFFHHRNRIMINFGRVPLIGNAIHPRPAHLPRISMKQLKALEDIERAAKKVQLEIETKPGDIHFINNLFVLHKRDSFKNGDGLLVPPQSAFNHAFFLLTPKQSVRRHTMAEAFGIAAGAVGFVSLLVQITSGINKLRAITNSAEGAPVEIQSVMRELDFLVHVMQEANDKAPSKIDPVVQHCQTNCDQVVKDLEDLNKILEAGSKGSARGKVSRIVAFRHWKEKVENLERDIQGAKLNLIMKSCNVLKYGGTFRFALSQLGIRWAAIIQLYIVTTSGRYSFRPIINFERVVPYTSPGFVILWKLRNLMISFEDGREQLVHLHRTDRTLPDHVDPSGKSYIENLLMAPARSPVEREYRYKLLELFMGEFEITRGTENSTFLSQCAHWIGEAPHLELLEILLGLGFNAAEVNIHDWPEHCSQDWSAPDIAEDPFFIEYLQLLWFAEMSPLHEAILFDSVELVRKWVSRCEKDERNALGQTPLHLAISKPDYLRILINAKYDLDARDNYGITPLMYAAATNQEEAVMMLIEADSDLNATDFNWNRNFIYYAGLRQHWNLILKILNTIENHLNTDAAEEWARFATFLFLVIFQDRLEDSGVSLNQLLAKCGTVNFLYDARNDKRNRCLLHDIRSPAELEALLANGFTLVNHVDSAGQSPVMAAADRCDSVLVDRLLAYGTDINRKDHFQRTSLWYVLQRREASFICYSTFRAMKTLRILLENDVDVLTRDACALAYTCPSMVTGMA
ncbi:hypothetical protein FPRO04_12100 [Fusarium proliferatum]|nr:hypothetical protein FPRO04_12100 [Fusarium proliferatum]